MESRQAARGSAHWASRTPWHREERNVPDTYQADFKLGSRASPRAGQHKRRATFRQLGDLGLLRGV